MTWTQWVNAVLSIAEQRGIEITVEYPTPTWATFTWQCRNKSNYGTAGSGAEMIGLTTPEQFTWLWTCAVGQVTRPNTPHGGSKGGGKRIVDRIKAKAVSKALEELLK
jgi:hypothetical protein